MSGAGEQFTLAQARRKLPLDALEEQAADWLLRRHFFDWSDEDQSKLDAWLEASPSNRVTYWRLNAALSRTERLVALRPFDRTVEPEKEKFRPGLLRAVAVFACLAIAGAMTAFYTGHGEAQTISTAVGGHKLVKLSDGSRIELNTNTEIRIEPWQRKVVLAKGEAFFEIKHDALHPFTVDVSGQRIVDLGTKFAVRQKADDVEVALLEGSARFESQRDGAQSHAAVLAPGDFAVATAHSFSVERVPEKSLLDALSWRQGKLVFHNTTLQAAAAEFNRYNQTKLAVEGIAAQLQIDGTFSATDPETFAQIASDILHLRVTQQHGIAILASQDVRRSAR